MGEHCGTTLWRKHRVLYILYQNSISLTDCHNNTWIALRGVSNETDYIFAQFYKKGRKVNDLHTHYCLLQTVLFVLFTFNIYIYISRYGKT